MMHCQMPWAILIAKYDHSNCDCLCISVLTHGDTGILYAKDTQYKPDILWNSFSADRCPTLAGMLLSCEKC
jgi:caspase 7